MTNGYPIVGQDTQSEPSPGNGSISPMMNLGIPSSLLSNQCESNPDYEIIT